MRKYLKTQLALHAQNFPFYVLGGDNTGWKAAGARNQAK
ncbi:hypothetical protein C725_1256 [Pacificimonas flava]|uniref:Uncharacterized protein n=1 Tax=Pacificimonas flava TaxID=1234595 RepID=M2SDE0_9SPHN|nr:hypothetical protein C725_1256 [Pacificimonas flava]